MISAKMQEAFNNQINKEFYSSYLYLSMAAHLESIGLAGFSNWMRIQAQEENFHGMAMFDYVLERGGNVKLESFPTPPHSWENVLDIFQEVLKHEEYVSSLINDLADVAEAERDRASLAFTQWFITEQVEEEASANDMIAKLKLVNLNGDAVFSMDKEAAARVFVAPVIK